MNYFPKDEFITLTVIGCLSAIGSLLIIILGIWLKKLHNFPFRLIIYLATSDFIFALSKTYLGYVFSYKKTGVECKILAAVQNYSGLSTLMITWMISFSLYTIIVKENFRVSDQEKKMILACLVIPFVLTVCPFFTQSYDEAKGWCWIGFKDEVDLMWIFVQFYGPWIIIVMFNMFFYYKIHKKLRSEAYLSPNSKLKKKLLNRLVIYPVILIVCFAPSFAHRMYYLIYKSDNPAFDLFSGSFAASVGLANTIAYGFTGKVRRSLKAAFVKMFYSDTHDLSGSTQLLEN